MSHLELCGLWSFGRRWQLRDCGIAAQQFQEVFKVAVLGSRWRFYVDIRVDMSRVASIG
jgi:hypothetical protein